MLCAVRCAMNWSRENCDRRFPCFDQDGTQKDWNPWLSHSRLLRLGRFFTCIWGTKRTNKPTACTIKWNVSEWWLFIHQAYSLFQLDLFSLQFCSIIGFPLRLESFDANMLFLWHIWMHENATLITKRLANFWGTTGSFSSSAIVQKNT